MIPWKQDRVNGLVVIIGGSAQATITPYNPLRVQKKIHDYNTIRYPPALRPLQVRQLLWELLRLHNLQQMQQRTLVEVLSPPSRPHCCTLESS